MKRLQIVIALSFGGRKAVMEERRQSEEEPEPGPDFVDVQAGHE